MLVDDFDILLVAEIGYFGYSAAYTGNIGRTVADLREWRWDTYSILEHCAALRKLSPCLMVLIEDPCI